MIKKLKLDEKKIAIIFVIFITCFALMLAILQPNNEAPDEEMKITISRYIAEHWQLPHGGDETIRDPMWGISYAFTPILSYMVGAVFLKVASFFTQDSHALYVSVRLVSVLCYCLFSIYVIKIARKLFKEKALYRWMFILFVTILPQVTFLGSYINNDSLALLSIAIIVYSWLRGMEDKWSIKSCIYLAVGLGICALSYYNAYGFILTSIILFITYFIMNKLSIKEFWKKTLIISAITLLICRLVVYKKCYYL